MQEFLPAVASAADLSTWGLIMGAGPVVKLVMALLALMSVLTWYITAYKWFFLRAAADESERFLDSFWRSRDIEQIYKQAQGYQRSPVAAMFLGGYTELAKLVNDDTEGSRAGDLDNVRRALQKAQTAQRTRLEAMVPFLATTGSSAPFIGLFGTVWGIMTSFREIGATGQAGIDTVAPGIAEALIATAIGLVAAIPAVIAFNYFQRRVRIQLAEMETFESDFLNIVRRHFLK